MRKNFLNTFFAVSNEQSLNIIVDEYVCVCVYVVAVVVVGINALERYSICVNKKKVYGEAALHSLTQTEER